LREQRIEPEGREQRATGLLERAAHVHRAVEGPERVRPAPAEDEVVVARNGAPSSVLVEVQPVVLVAPVLVLDHHRGSEGVDHRGHVDVRRDPVAQGGTRERVGGTDQRAQCVVVLVLERLLLVLRAQRGLRQVGVAGGEQPEHAAAADFVDDRVVEAVAVAPRAVLLLEVGVQAVERAVALEAHGERLRGRHAGVDHHLRREGFTKERLVGVAAVERELVDRLGQHVGDHQGVSGGQHHLPLLLREQARDLPLHARLRAVEDGAVVGEDTWVAVVAGEREVACCLRVGGIADEPLESRQSRGDAGGNRGARVGGPVALTWPGAGGAVRG